jgi:hypothetical protein
MLKFPNTTDSFSMGNAPPWRETTRAWLTQCPEGSDNAHLEEEEFIDSPPGETGGAVQSAARLPG